MRRALIFVLILAPCLAAQDKKPDPKKKEKPDGKIWMCKRGELLWEEKFEKNDNQR